MAGYCMSVRLCFHEPQASENIATSENTAGYCMSVRLYFHEPQASENTATSENTAQELGCLFLALDGTSMRTDLSTSGRKYRKLVNNAVFICNESLFVVSAAATSAFQLKHMPRLLHSICPVGYWIRTIEYGKILVMLLYGKYCGHVYVVYNNK